MMLLLFSGIALFAQDDYFGYNGFTMLPSIEVAGRFDITRAIEMEKDDWAKIYGLGVSVRLLNRNNKNVHYGMTATFSYGFITQMEYTYPDDDEKITITKEETDSLYNLSFFIGLGLSVPLTRKISLVSDLGVSLNLDNAEWEKILVKPSYWNNYVGETRYTELTTARLGLTANAGLQFLFGLFTLEAGATFNYYFGKWNTFDHYIANPYNKNDSKQTLAFANNRFSSAKDFRISTPYVAIGLKI